MVDSFNIGSRRVVTCYDMLDVAFLGGITDFTDGKYGCDVGLSYDLAQRRQANWLLDEIRCGDGSYVLDIGCGYGRILEAAEKRGADARGITLSPRQRARCVEKGLRAYVIDYKNIQGELDGPFDGIIANGSLEHFVQVRDALEGRQDQIYEEMFRICHSITKPGGRVATTAIHFAREVDPEVIARGSKAFPAGSDESHFAKILLENLGGWYPIGNQLEGCARGLFTLENREEGTRDYHLTSEYWLEAIKRGVKKSPSVWWAIVGKFLKNHRAAWGMLDTWLVSQSWMWQFRPREDGTPTRLYRDTWKRVD